MTGTAHRGAPAAVRDMLDLAIFNLAKNDIRREIYLADEEGLRSQREQIHGVSIPAGPYAGGGNLLAALGLVCYTEFVGSMITGGKGLGWSELNFTTAFRRLGPAYCDFEDKGGFNAYKIFRCGLVHEYVSHPTTFAMRFVDESDPLRCAVGLNERGFTFVVRPYLEHLLALAARVREDPDAAEPAEKRPPPGALNRARAHGRRASESPF